MAATYADLSRLDAILKNKPLVEELQDAFNKATPLAEKITQQLQLTGRKGIFPVSFGANEGIFARADRGTFGASHADAPSLAEVTAKFVYATFDISGPAMSATRDTPGAFEDALALNLEKTLLGVKLDMARIILNNGASTEGGNMGAVVARTNTTTFTAKNPFGLTYKTARPLRNILRKGMAIDVQNVGSPWTVQATGAISSIVHGANASTIVIDTAESGTIAATNIITRAGSRSYEPDGFFGGVQTSGSYLNIARSGLDGWNGVVVDAAAGGALPVALDPDMLRDTLDTIMETSGRTPSLIVCNYKQRRNIYNLYAPQIRYMPMMLPAGIRTTKSDGSSEETLGFDDLPVIAERFFPPEHIGFVDASTWYHAIDKDVEWIQGLNGTVLHFTLTADLFRAVLRTYRNFVTMFPSANGYLYGLSE